MRIGDILEKLCGNRTTHGQFSVQIDIKFDFDKPDIENRLVAWITEKERAEKGFEWTADTQKVSESKQNIALIAYLISTLGKDITMDDEVDITNSATEAHHDTDD